MKTGMEGEKGGESAVEPDVCFHSPTPRTEKSMCVVYFPGAEPPVPFDSLMLVELLEAPVKHELMSSEKLTFFVSRTANRKAEASLVPPTAHRWAESL